MSHVVVAHSYPRSMSPVTIISNLSIIEICLVVITFNSDMGDLVPITMTLDNNIRTLFCSMHVKLGECITQEKQGMNYMNKARRKMEDKPR